MCVLSARTRINDYDSDKDVTQPLCTRLLKSPRQKFNHRIPLVRFQFTSHFSPPRCFREQARSLVLKPPRKVFCARAATLEVLYNGKRTWFPFWVDMSLVPASIIIDGEFAVFCLVFRWKTHPLLETNPRNFSAAEVPSISSYFEFWSKS